MAYGDPSPVQPIVSGVPAGGGLPPRMSLDAVACLSGVTTAQLAGLNGPFDGAVVVTTGASATGDGLGKAWVWVEGDTTTANGTTVLGTGPYGRWRDATALTGGGGSSGTSITLNPAAGQITDAGTVQASNVQLAIAGARVYTGILAATGGQLIKVITNTSAFDATFNHQDGTATAANRVITSTGSAFVLAAGKSATFVYDTTAQRWRIAGQDVPYAATAGSAATAATISGITIAAAISSLSSLAVGTIVLTNGHTTAYDGGACDLTVVTGTQTVNGVLVYASAGGKSLIRLQNGKPITAQSCGLKLDGTTDDTAALQNAVDVVGALEHGALHFLPPGALGIVTCRITDTIYVRSPVGGFQLKTGGGCAIGNSNVNVTWQGASNKPAFSVSTFGALFEGFTIAVSTGYTLAQAFDLTNAIHLCSRNTWRNVRVYALGSGVLTSGWTTNHYRVNTRVGAVDGLDYASGVDNANCEDMVFDGVCVAGWVHSAFRQSDSQPYNWLWYACKFEQNGLPSAARGVVHWCDSTSATGTAEGCFYYNIELALYSGGEGFKIMSPSAELVKKWYYSPSTGYTNEVYMDLGRTASDGHGNTSSGPFGFAAGDVDYIKAGGQAIITLANFQARLGGASAGRIDLSYGATLNAAGCIFPNANWLNKGPDPVNGTVRGGIYVHGCKAMDATGSAVELGEYRGACSPSMSVRLDNFAATSITIPLERAETDTRYTVNVAIKVLSGTYTGRVERISGVTTSQFTVELSAAPSSASIVITCDISYPPSARQKTALAGSATFSETSVLRSTSGGTTGASVSSDFCLEFLVACKTALASMPHSNEDNCCIASRGYSYTVGGWSFEFDWFGGLSHRWHFLVGNNVGASLQSPDYTDAELNQLQYFAVRGTDGVLTLFRQGLPIATLTTAVVQSSGEFCAGNRLSNPTLLENKHVLIYALGAESTAPSDAEILARYDAVRALEAIPTTWTGHTQTHRYLTDGRSTITNDATGGADPLTLRLVSDGSLTTSNAPTITATVARFY